MKPIEPRSGIKGTRVTFAKDQSQYIPLPVVIPEENEYVVLSEWEPTDEERGLIAGGANIFLQQLNFGQPLQPVNLQVVSVADDVPIVSLDGNSNDGNL